MKDSGTHILEMESECHQRLKHILLEFLPKRHNLFVGVRDLLDPAVDALETCTLLSEMDTVDKRLEEAVVNFQPGKKRSILSLVSSGSPSSEKNKTVPRLEDFAPLAILDMEALRKSENVHEYSFLSIKKEDAWEPALAVITRQHCLHIYRLPADSAAVTRESSPVDQEFAIQSVLESGSPTQSVALLTCDVEQTECSLEILPCIEAESDSEETETDCKVHLRFPSAEEATEWLKDTQHLVAPQPEPEFEPVNELVIDVEIVQVRV